MNNFKSTYIYVKTCNHCGLKYLGKSCLKTRKNVCKYNGSGKYWKRHLKTHGKDYRTDIINFFNEDEQYFCVYFCVQFSKENDIVKSNKWANLIIENGLDGCNAMLGRKQTLSHKRKISEKNKGKKRTKEVKLLMSEIKKGCKNPMYGKTLSKEHKRKISEKMSGEKHHFFGKKRSEESKLLMSRSHIGILLSEEHKRKISKALLGKKKGRQKVIKCPHCNKEGGITNMKRYHFDYCKKINN